MTAFARFRLFHLTLAVLAIFAYVTAEAGWIHAWIGYALAAVFLARLAAAAIAPRLTARPGWLIRPRDIEFRQGLASPIVGKVLQTLIVACLVCVTLTGVAMQQKWNAAWAAPTVVTQAFADDEDDDEEGEGAYSDIHEASANLLFVFVGLHVAYLIRFRRRYALSMVFVGGTDSGASAPVGGLR
jgi:3-ketosteroid 9alpha-monooxygenase subunit B